MYEINLVPDVKAELLNKQKLRNLVILICIAAGVACVVVVLSLVTVVGGQAISLSKQDNEINCRSTGIGDCKEYKETAVNKYANLETLLTMKDQMSDIAVVNNNMLSLSRVFSMFDVILPDNSSGQGTVSVSMIDIDFGSMAFTINASSTNSIGFTARESFAKAMKLTYYDYGRYMRKVDGMYEPIPTYCITEVEENGYLYGIYHKGQAGCETGFVSESGKTTVKSEDIKIRRTYKNEQDKNSYMAGNDILAGAGKEKVGGYYFESECIEYDDGVISTELTLNKCGLMEGDVELESGSYGRSEGSEMLLKFTARFAIAREAFLTKNKHMIFVGPTKQNVTDSYVPVRDIFTKDKNITEEIKNGN